jgi:NhaP-type Na+/H+ or K+/H+ antiporter
LGDRAPWFLARRPLTRLRFDKTNALIRLIKDHTQGERMEPTHLFELVIVMFVAIIVLHYAAHRFGMPPSVALLAGGGLLAFMPGLPTIEIDPALVLVIFLPPLLLDGAWSIPLGRLRRHVIGIASLAVGAVFFT